MRRLVALCLLLPSCASGPPEIDGARIHCLDTGSGDRALVFIHGWASDHTAFAGQIPALRDLGRLIAIDLPGHGLSDKPAIEYSMRYWARAIKAVLDAKGVRHAVLVGHSNGVPVVRQFYRDYPDRCRALVTIDGALVQVATEKIMQPFLEKLRGVDYREFAARLTRDMLRRGHLTDAEKRSVLAMTERTSQSAMVAGVRAALDEAVWKPDTIEVPVLMVNVPQPTWSDAYLKRVRAVAPKLEYHALTGRTHGGLNHFLMLDEPEPFNELLRKFVHAHGLLR